MSAESDLWAWDAASLLEAYSNRTVSPVEVVTNLLERIDVLNPTLRAYLAVDPDGAVTAAKSAERRWLVGDPDVLTGQPLCGVPVSVKDTLEIAGMPTTYGSLAFKGNTAPDSALGKRLRAAGAVIIGKTNTSEFALSTHTANNLGEATANPWDVSRTAGGSSGGASAAVAAGLGPIGIGTDATGSVRIPASFTGIFGMKPTFGAIKSAQRWRAAPTRSHLGLLTRTTADARIAFAALSECGPSGPVASVLSGDELCSAVGGLRFVVVDDDGSASVRQAVEALRDLGAQQVTARPLPPVPVAGDIAPGVWAYSGDHYAAAESLRPDFWEQHGHQLTEYARPVYEGGRRALAWQYRRVLDEALEYARIVAEWFTGFDLVVTPLAPEAPALPASPAEAGLGPRYPLVTAWNIAGNPAASVPMGHGPSGLPVAAQIVGRHGDDAVVLAAASALERRHPWAHHWPESVWATTSSA